MPLVSDLPRKNDFVQSVIIHKGMYSLYKAKRILRELGYFNKGHDTTANFFRFRQFNPDDNKKYKIVSDSRLYGVKYVIEY